MKNNWQTKKLGDLCEISTGKSNTNEAVKGGEYSFFDRSKVIKRSNRFLFDCEALIIPGEGAQFFPKYFSGKFDLHQRAYALFNFKKDINIRFVEYVLIFNHKYFENVAVGTTAKSLRLRHFQDMEISFPSLSEQKRIVKKLNTIFEKTTKAKENVERNIKNSKELFESYLQDHLKNTKYEVKALGELCDNVEYGSSTKSKVEGKMPVLRMGNIQDGRFKWDKLVYSSDDNEIERYSLKYDDVLFNRTNSPEWVGKTAIYKNEKPAIFAGYLIRINRKKHLLDGDYLNYFLNSGIAKDYGKTVVISSVNQANINGTKLKNYPIPTPPLSVQRTIVKKLDSLSEMSRSFESNCRRKLRNLDEFKEAVLSSEITK